MKLWSHNFYWICETNLWLYASMYALFLHLPQPMGATSGGTLWATSLCFIIGIWLPGLFTAHLLELMQRKRLYLYALAGCLLCTWLLPYTDRAAAWCAEEELFSLHAPTLTALLRLAQGVCFGLAINTGNTLSVDVSPSLRRDEANTLYTRLGRAGIGVGLIAAFLFSRYFGSSGIYYFALAAGTLAFFSACLLHVPFHAPLQLPLCSSDRFVLPRLWPEMLNIFFVAAVPGVMLLPLLKDMAAAQPELHACLRMWLAALGGFVCALLLLHNRRPKLAPPVLIFAGLCTMAIGVCTHIFTHETYPLLCQLFLLTFGTELATTGLLTIVVRMAKHSQRCTAANSYLLAWESGFAGGIGFSLCWGEGAGLVPFYCALIGLLLFVFFTFRHYRKNRLN